MEELMASSSVSLINAAKCFGEKERSSGSIEVSFTSRIDEFTICHYRFSSFSLSSSISSSLRYRDAVFTKRSQCSLKNSLIARDSCSENGIIYLKPLTYMNNSGESAYKILRYYQILSRQFGCLTKKNQDLRASLFVIQDDLDLDLGKWKISDDSRSGGNKGIQSIINHLKTQRFTRLRLGIKNKNLRQIIPPEKFVLQKFSPTELEILHQSTQEGLKKLESYISR
jgi:peptidyl-tRNA hydrolase